MESPGIPSQQFGLFIGQSVVCIGCETAYVPPEGPHAMLLVEPQKVAFGRLWVNYKDEGDNLRFENVAIAEKGCLRTLYNVKG